MSTYSWRGQTALLSIEESDGGTSVPVGVLQDWEITVDKEIVYLRGSGSPKIKDRQQTEIEVGITGTVMAFDTDTYDKLVDYDSANSELKDTEDVKTFKVTAQAEPTTSDTTEKWIVKEVDFPGLSIGGSSDEFIGIDLDGTGSDLERASA